MQYKCHVSDVCRPATVHTAAPVGAFCAVFVFVLSFLAFCLPAFSGTEGLLINEFLANNNSSYVDEDGDKSDWIELYNGSATAADLTDLYLTDTAANLTEWRFPSVTLGAGEYLVVFASGKNRTVAGQPLHTNFKLSSNGEYLALVDGDGFTVVHEYAPMFPEQLSNVSYGIGTNDAHEMRYFAVSTPGLANSGEFSGIVADTKFSANRGFYSAPFELAITSATSNAVIRYTLDDSAPTEVYGTVYTGPIVIDRTTVVRAMAYKAGYRSTDVDTHTYIFLADVLTQPDNPAGFPATWGGVNADYGMDPRIVNSPAYSNLMMTSMMSLPAVSLVTHRDNLFSAGTGIYANPGGSGSAWERPVSMEWIAPDGSREFQVNAGLRINGGYFRDLGVTRKKTFRVAFKGMYGPTKLQTDIFPDQDDAESYDNITLRAGANDGYNNWGNYYVQYIIDEFVRRTHLAMGRPSAHGTFVHLYVDGLYWGLYNATEHIDAGFTANYFGGNKADWDVRSQDELMDGTWDSWNAMMTQCQAGLSDNAEYQKLQGNNPDGTRNPAYPVLLDVPNYIDYMLLNFWIGNADWPGNNWRAACNRTSAGTGFKFTDWDAELSMLSPWTGLYTDMTGAGGGAADPYTYLRQNPEFMLLFADHAQKFMASGGVCSAEMAVERYTALAASIEQAIIGETARWGDQYGGYPCDLETWRTARDNMLMNYLPQRPAVFMDQLRNSGLYPSVDAPVFNRQGGAVSNGFELVMSAAEPIYYTLDNTDPREAVTGNAHGTLCTGPVPLHYSLVVKARARSAGGVWSALNEALFVVPVEAPLQVTELMYNPRSLEGAETNSGFASGDFEFIELRNGTSNTIGLAGMRLTDGITFDFAGGDVPTLNAGEYVLVVKSLQAFTNRYPAATGMHIAGEYTGSLNNGGEQVTVKDGLNSNVVSFTYGNGRGWPAAADGAGHSLVPLVFDGQNNGLLDYGGNWRAGTYREGSPGELDPPAQAGLVINEIVAHTDYTNALHPEYDSNDAIELYNAGTGAVSFANWYLSDRSTNLKQWAITNAGLLPVGGWITLDEVTGFHSPITNGFGIDKAGDELYLSYLPGTAADRVVDCIRFKAQENERSLGRYPDGGSWWYAMTRTTNTAIRSNAPALFEVVVSELMYHPRPTADNPEDNTADEYIELHNITGTSVTFVAEGGTWRIDGDVKYVFPAGFSLTTNGYVVVVPFDPTNVTLRTRFLNAYGLTNAEVRLAGPYTGKLSNHGGRVALERPLSPDLPGDGVSWVIVDEVIYFDRYPWSSDTDGTGRPLNRLTTTKSGNDPANWDAGFWSSPGLTSPVFRISSPAYGETLLYGSSVPVAVDFDSSVITGSVSGVEFFVDGVSLGVDAVPPYGCVLGPLTNERTYKLTATLTDNTGTRSARPVVVGVSTVNNGSGASDIGIAVATLNGTISSNGSADVNIYWGDTDGSTNAVAWTNVLALGRCTGSFSAQAIGLLANKRYYYRCQATNAYGTSWASATTNFVTRPPQVSLSLENSPFSESGGTATVHAVVSRLSATNVTVGLQFSGTAVYGAEYGVSATSIVIPAGEISSSITMTGIDDAAAEVEKTVIVGIGSLISGATGTPAQVTALLTSDDPLVTNTAASNVTDSTVMVGGNLTLGYEATAYVYWGTVDGGTTKTNWATATDVGTCQEGFFTTTITGLTASQTYYFRCYVTNAGGEDWADSSLTFKTAQPFVSIDDTSVIEGNAGTASAVFQVRLSARSASNVSVRCSTSNGTAIAGVDYVSTNGNVVIAAGQPGGQFVVSAIGDTLDEWPSENFFVNLTNATSCVISDGRANGVIKDDDVGVTLVTWLYKMKVSFPGYKRGEPLTNFPALVVFDTNLANFAYSQLRTSGQDTFWSSLRFANSNVTALLNYEVEQWSTNGRSYVWVQVPELADSNSFIWAYWGNPTATNTPAYTTNGSTWSAGYKGVWHMEAASARDSTPLGHNGTAMGSVSHVTNGVIAGANEFDADVDYISVPHSTDFTLAGDCTISAWINSDDIGNKDEGFVGTYNGNGFIFSLQNDAGNTLRLWSWDWRSSDTAVQDGRWNHVAYTRSGTVGRYYINGVCVRDRGDALVPGDGGDLHLGAAGTAWGGNRFDGKMDEVRISTETRSSNWIWACWIDQVSNAVFTSYGLVEAADVRLPSFFVVFGATNITDSSAYLTARLTSTGTAKTAASIFWGQDDGGHAPGGWAHTNALGSVTSKPYVDFTFYATGLQANTYYYYAYQATNSWGTNWASAGFSTRGRPVVENTGGVTNVGIGTATLRGSLLKAGSAQVTVYWGPVDGGTNKSAWATNMSPGTVAGFSDFSVDAAGMLYGVRYYYRCYATNGYGDDWADESTPFLTTATDANELAVLDGLVLWLDAADIDGDGNTGNNPADGSSVSAWYDRSGLGHGADNRDGNAPSCLATGLNAKPVLDFDGSSYLYTTYDFDALAAYTIFTLARYTGGDSERIISSRTHNWLFGFWGNGDERWYAEGWIYGAGDGNTNWHVHAGTITGESDPAAGFWKDGRLLTSDSHGSHDTVYKPGRLGLGGGSSAGGEASRCQVAEVIIYNRVLTSNEMDAVGSYISGKYALTTTYSGKTGAPAVGVVNSGASNVTSYAAQLTGILSASGAVFNVWLHWGDDDAGQGGDWDHSLLMGSFTNVNEVRLAHDVAGLSNETTYYYTFSASNAAGERWAEPSSKFTTATDLQHWAMRAQATFTGYFSGETLYNFPALVILGTNIPGFSYSQFGTPDGRDLRFVDAAGRMLDYEVESWNPAGSSLVWVQVQDLAATGTNAIWALWGNSAASRLPCTTNGAVWDDGYRAVWHMRETAAVDSTGRGHTGTPQGSMTTVAGAIGTAGDFRSSGCISFPSSTDWTFAGNWTWSAWGYTSTGGDRGIMGNWGQSMIFALRNGHQMNAALNGLNWRWDVGGVAVPSGSWHLLTCTRSGSTGRFYLDGVEVDTWTATANNLNAGAASLEIGTGGSGWRGYWNGLLDEVRIEGVGRSADWLRACYSNQVAGSTFITYGEANPFHGIANRPVSGLTSTSAVFNALLYAPGTSYWVNIYWGPVDGLTNASAWAHTNSLGLFIDVGMTNVCSTGMVGISEFGTNYCTWRVTNSTYSYWSQPSIEWDAERIWQGLAGDSQWGTSGNWIGDNVPDVPSESARFAGFGTGEVRLGGRRYTNSSLTFSAGSYSLTDTNASPGSLALGSLLNSAGTNSIGVGLTVTGTAEVRGGALTLASADSFSAGLLKLNGGSLRVSGNSALVNGLTEWWFDGNFDDSYIDPIDSGNGFLARTPGATSMLDTTLAFGGSAMNTRSGGLVGVDTIGAAWWGKLVVGPGSPLAAGNITFASASDDGSTVWIDRDQNGRFEHSGAAGDEMIVNNKGWHGVNYSYGVVNLAAGIYDIAMGFYEGGGGEYMEVRYGSGSLAGNWGALTTINPAAAGQNGLWKSGGIGPVAMTNTPLSVTASSSVSASSGANVAALGRLTMTNGVTLATTAGSPIGFLGATIPAGATSVVFLAGVDTYLTMASGLEGPGATVTIAKTGAGRLFLDKAGSNLGAATFDVRTGTLAAVHSDAFGAGTIQLGGGELLLSSPGGNITYAKSVSVVKNSVLTAGKAGSGVAGPLTNTVSGDITFTGSQSLTNRATDNYTLRLSGQLVGNGTNVVTAGSVIIDDPCFNAVRLGGGSLVVYSNLTVNSLIQDGGTFTMAGISRDLTVSNALTLAGTLNFSGGPNLVVSTATVTLNSGASVTYDKPLSAGVVTLNSGATLNLGTNGMNVGILAWRNGGVLNMSGPINASVSMNFWPQGTIGNTLSGAGGVNIGDPEDTWGYVALTGTNSYAGTTKIGRGVLRADENVGLPDNSLLVFNQDNREEYCVLETSGTFARNIGQAPGEVYWQNMGGFAARGGNLAVTLEDGAQLDWSSSTNGFNNRDSIQFGSPYADGMVELTNPMDLNDTWRRIQVCDNPAVKTDFLRLSGTISGNGTWNDASIRFNEGSGNGFYNTLIELTGTNTYSQRTIIDCCALYAIDGTGLPASSLLYFEGNDVWAEAVLVGHGTFARRIGHDVPGQVYWGGLGGFAARGGLMTVLLEDGATLTWGDYNTGFNGQWLQLNSQYADNRVVIGNPINMSGDDRYVIVFDNLDTDQDVAVFAGAVSGSNHDSSLRKTGPGTLWLKGPNTFQQYVAIDWGTIRIDSQANLPAGTTVTFVNWWRGGDWPKTLESKGTLAFNLSSWNAAGKLSFEWGDGGFSAFGGPLTVNLQGGAMIPWDTWDGGFNGVSLHLGSHSADNVVTMANTLDTRGGWRQIRAWGNPHSQADYAVISNMTSTAGDNSGHVQVFGDGILKFAGDVDQMNYLRVEDNATVLINGTFSGANLDSNNGQTGAAIPKSPGWGATPTIGGKGTVNLSNEVRLRGWSATSYTTLAPGDGVGTLNVTVANNFVLEDGNVTYEWELGTNDSDKVVVTGDLWMGNGWKLRLVGAGGSPHTNDQYILFTYSGNCTYTDPMLDFSAIPADWRTNGVQVIHDTTSTPARIYLTGLYSVPGVSNAPPTDLTANSATLNGIVYSMAAPLDVSVFWGKGDGTTNSGAWAHTNWIGFYSGVTANVSFNTGGMLASKTTYYYAFAGSNQSAVFWATPSYRLETLDGDLDHDGLPDSWEQHVFGGTNVTSGGTDEDWDGDGASDRDEYIAGTVATNKDSSFRLDLNIRTGKLVVRFEGLEATGQGYEGMERRYDLEQATNLLTGQWEEAAGCTNLPGEGGTITYTNQAGQILYYRGKVRLQ